MNYIDITIVILLLISAIRGLVKGFIYEIASLIALLAGVWGAIKFSGITKTFIIEKLTFNSQHIDIIAFIVTFIGIIILIHFIGKAIEKAVEAVALGIVNRLFGMLFAVFKAAFILGIVIIVIERVDPESSIIPQEDIKQSKLYTPLQNITTSTFPFLLELYNEIVDEPEKKGRSNRRSNSSVA